MAFITYIPLVLFLLVVISEVCGVSCVKLLSLLLSSVGSTIRLLEGHFFCHCKQ